VCQFVSKKTRKSVISFARFRFFCIFAPVNANSRRRRAAKVLLAVYIPMLLLLSLHVHHQRMAEAVDCYQCAHHQPHAGHITAVQDALHDCLLCQLQSEAFVAADEVGVPVMAAASDDVAAIQQPTRQTTVASVRLRGPPVCLC